ncbi:Lar family restriction alleviation protein [Paraburkholderia sp. WSM4179]|uniref:Lar family restriction alleviation protein n=1 Tax=unclassified Paraburkholderia TaxID=2615204 RepID=UPI002474EE57|nr:hypothetical protein [Paraburkholderia sp. WSM4179]MDH6147309.1 hypothetical protein [Paraburkholderia sp. WSM4179]
MKELEDCPFCGSGDVRGSSGIVHCYICKAQIQRATTAAACEAWNTRVIFMRNGFSIKEDQNDLKDYVYRAAAELLARDGAALAAPVAWMTTYEVPPKTTVRLLADMNERQRNYVMKHAMKVVALMPGETLKDRPPL